MGKYIVVINRGPRFGSEEYDGGHTLESARAEAAFFVNHTPSGVPVRICTVDDDRGERLVTVERVRDGS